MSLTISIVLIPKNKYQIYEKKVVDFIRHIIYN
nr:MAG TPA: hypothetical protein [Caudoviricetes sp.]